MTNEAPTVAFLSVIVIGVLDDVGFFINLYVEGEIFKSSAKPSSR